jgi:SagB-type dehydrogenase family enzyme
VNRSARTPPKQFLSLSEFIASELPVLADIVTFSNSHELSPYVNSTAIKSPELTYRGSIFSKTRLLGEEYILNYQPSPYSLARVTGIANFSTDMVLNTISQRALAEDDSEKVALPPFKLLKSPLGSVVRSRRSRRTFASSGISLDDLSTILFHGAGITGEQPIAGPTTSRTLGANRKIALRAAPSGGGLYPIHLHIFAKKVAGLDPGIYNFLPHSSALRVIRRDCSLDIKPLAAFGDLDAANAAFLLCFGYAMYENARKYGDSALAYAFIEVGQISQNIHLCCTALGLGSCDLGGFNKPEMERALALDGLTNHVIHAMIIGR